MTTAADIFDGATVPVPRIALNQRKAAAALDITEQTLRAWEKAGKITSAKPNGRLRMYLVDDLKRLARTGTANSASN